MTLSCNVQFNTASKGAVSGKLSCIGNLSSIVAEQEVTVPLPDNVSAELWKVRQRFLSKYADPVSKKSPMTWMLMPVKTLPAECYNGLASCDDPGYAPRICFSAFDRYDDFFSERRPITKFVCEEAGKEIVAAVSEIAARLMAEVALKRVHTTAGRGRHNAILALSAVLEVPEALSTVLTIATQDKDGKSRIAAIRSINNQFPRSAFSSQQMHKIDLALCKVAINDPSFEVRLSALSTLTSGYGSMTTARLLRGHAAGRKKPDQKQFPQPADHAEAMEEWWQEQKILSWRINEIEANHRTAVK